MVHPNQHAIPPTAARLIKRDTGCQVVYTRIKQNVVIVVLLLLLLSKYFLMSNRSELMLLLLLWSRGRGDGPRFDRHARRKLFTMFRWILSDNLISSSEQKKYAMIETPNNMPSDLKMDCKMSDGRT